MKPFALDAPAKINLTLEVLGKRADGYHELRSLMVPVDLRDVLTFLPSDKLELRCSHPVLSCGSDNLVMKAALLLKPKAGKKGAGIFLKKNAPLAAGLGSGSSDAAATLLGLRRLWRLRISPAGLKAKALRLGSDVPLFLKRKPCLAKGRGEKLTPLNGLPAFWLVLCNPGFGVSTKWAYRNLKPVQEPRPDASAKTLACWRKKDWKGMGKVWANDLQAVAVKRHPRIETLRKALLKAGALAAAMSGSGPTVFGVFASRKAALKAGKKMEKKVKFCRAVRALV